VEVGVGAGGGVTSKAYSLTSCLNNQHTVHGDERHIHYIEQIIYENTHIQQLMFNKKLMKLNKEKTKNDFMRKQANIAKKKEAKTSKRTSETHAKWISVRFICYF
jgi:hypothetical protein